MTPWFLGNSSGSSGWWGSPEFIIPLAVWSGIWTGLSLWHAARRDQKGWFIFFLLVHTAGIIELIYLIFVAKAFREQSPPKASRSKKK